jgi:hypothetical protein
LGDDGYSLQQLYVKKIPTYQIERPLSVRHEQLIVQKESFSVILNTSSPAIHINLNFNHLICKLWVIISTDGKLCEKISDGYKTSIVENVNMNTERDGTITEVKTIVKVQKPVKRQLRPHPFKTMELRLNNFPYVRGDGDFFSHTMPIMYGQTPSDKYMAYQIIFHNTPPIIPYDYHYMNTSLGDYLTFKPPTSLSTTPEENLSSLIEEATIEHRPQSIDAEIVDPPPIMLSSFQTSPITEISDLNQYIKTLNGTQLDYVKSTSNQDYTTINLTDNVDIIINLDQDVIRDFFGGSDTMRIEVFGDSINILEMVNGVSNCLIN